MILDVVLKFPVATFGSQWAENVGFFQNLELNTYTEVPTMNTWKLCRKFFLQILFTNLPIIPSLFPPTPNFSEEKFCYIYSK